MTGKEIINYWVDSSEVDFQAMETLFNNGHYVWALFIGHLVLEKLLKACYVKNIGCNSPQIHHLLRLAEGAGLELSESQAKFLLEVTSFNIAARYPDIKNRFFKKASKEFTLKNITEIKETRKWLLRNLKE